MKWRSSEQGPIWCAPGVEGLRKLFCVIIVNRAGKCLAAYQKFLSEEHHQARETTAVTASCHSLEICYCIVQGGIKREMKSIEVEFKEIKHMTKLHTHAE